MQLRFATQGTTGEDYVSSRQWERARLAVCPLHPQGGCGFASHGTYGRVKPAGTRIRRWYCPQGGVTFSALPDWLSARLPGALTEIEREVRLVEAAPSLAGAVRDERPEIGLAGVLRYYGRRVRGVHRALAAIRGLYPDLLAGTVATVTAFAGVLPALDSVLIGLREVAQPHLAYLPAPLGFGPARIGVTRRGSSSQHETGAARPVVVIDLQGHPGQPP